jgi:hypothetical protein
MVQLFRDQLRDEGALTAWVQAIPDLVTTSISERRRRNRTVAQSLTVAPTPVSRVLGLLGVIGGILLLSGFVGAFMDSPDLSASRIALFNIGAIAVAIAVHGRQSGAGRFYRYRAQFP